jgi:hypothetical protein
MELLFLIIFKQFYWQEVSKLSIKNRLVSKSVERGRSEGMTQCKLLILK